MAVIKPQTKPSRLVFFLENTALGTVSHKTHPLVITNTQANQQLERIIHQGQPKLHLIFDGAFSMQEPDYFKKNLDNIPTLLNKPCGNPAANTCCEKGLDVDMTVTIAANFTLPNGLPFNEEFSAQLLLRGCRGISQFAVAANTNDRPQLLPTIAGSAYDCPAPNKSTGTKVSPKSGTDRA